MTELDPIPDDVKMRRFAEWMLQFARNLTSDYEAKLDEDFDYILAAFATGHDAWDTSSELVENRLDPALTDRASRATPSAPSGEPVVAWEWAWADDPFYWNLQRAEPADGGKYLKRALVYRRASPEAIPEGMVATELEKLFAEMGTTAVDPVWADHVELPKAALRRWIKTLRPFVRRAAPKKQEGTI